MNKFQKYHEQGYFQQFLGQEPRAKIPGRINHIDNKGQPVWTGIKNWPNRWIEPCNFELYDEHDSGVCLKTDYFPFIDIDLEDGDLVNKVMSVIVGTLGEGLFRLREGSNRVGVAYRTKDPFKAPSLVRFRRTYVDGKSVVSEQVEFKCRSQQFVAEGIHTSGLPYCCFFKPAAELPLITLEQLTTLSAHIRELIPKDYVVENHPSLNKTSSSSKNPGVFDLYEDHEVLTDRGLVTVKEIIANRGQYQYCHDPFEPDYGEGNPRIAQIYYNKGSVVISSLAHGGITYFLHDLSAIREFSRRLVNG